MSFCGDLRGGIAVQADDLRLCVPEERPAIAASPEGAIHINAAIARSQSLQHLRQQHRDMRRFAHQAWSSPDAGLPRSSAFNSRTRAAASS